MCGAASSGAADATAQQTTATTTSQLHRWERHGALVAGLAATLLTSSATGGAAAQAAPTATTVTTSGATVPSETIHTTANHPWRTTDRGWVHAGDLRPGEQVVTLPGQAGNASSATTATVAWVRAVPGTAEMDNLTVAQDHTYAVGAMQAVVHNCPEGFGKLAGQEINVSEKGLAKVEQHLSTVDPDNGENAMMLQRLRDALAEGRPIVGADASFYMHELSESTMVAQGMTRDDAHLAAIAKYEVDPRSIYHPDVLKAFPQGFNNSWFTFWGIER